MEYHWQYHAVEIQTWSRPNFSESWGAGNESCMRHNHEAIELQLFAIETNRNSYTFDWGNADHSLTEVHVTL